MSFFKKLKEKWKIVTGTLGVIVLGATGGYWAYEKVGHERNLVFESAPLSRAVFGGDTGIDTPQRAGVVKAIREFCPEHVFLLGDLGYPVGLTNRSEYDLHVKGPFGDLCPGHKRTYLVPGNHDAIGSKSERGFLAKKLFDGADGKVFMPNYYYGVIFPNACVAIWDSTVADVKIGGPAIQKRQEKFIERLLSDERCEGKELVGLTHAGIYSKGDHGNTHSKAYFSWFKKSLRGKIKHLIAGHDHNLMDAWCGHGTCHWTSGAVAKLRTCKTKEGCFAEPGFITLSDGEIRVRRLINVEAFVDSDHD